MRRRQNKHTCTLKTVSMGRVLSELGQSRMMPSTDSWQIQMILRHLSLEPFLSLLVL